MVGCPLLGRVRLVEVQPDANMIDADELDQVLEMLDPAIKPGRTFGCSGR